MKLLGKWRHLFIADDGNFYLDPMFTKLSDLPMRYTKKIKVNDTYTEDMTPYLYLPVQYKRFACHKIMGNFIHNPCPTGKFRYDRIDHIIPSQKTNNSLANLRWVNAHLNAINRYLLTDISFDYDVRLWTAEFSTHCRGYVFYHCGFDTSFKGIWEKYKAKRQEAFEYWNNYYINDYNTRCKLEKNII